MEANKIVQALSRFAKAGISAEQAIKNAKENLLAMNKGLISVADLFKKTVQQVQERK